MYIKVHFSPTKIATQMLFYQQCDSLDDEDYYANACLLLALETNSPLPFHPGDVKSFQGLNMGTSLIRNSTPPGPYSKTSDISPQQEFLHTGNIEACVLYFSLPESERKVDWRAPLASAAAP